MKLGTCKSKVAALAIKRLTSASAICLLAMGCSVLTEIAWAEDLPRWRGALPEGNAPLVANIEMIDVAIDALGKVPEVEAVVLVHAGTIVDERHWRASNPNRAIALGGVSSAVTAALIGIASSENLLSRDQPINTVLRSNAFTQEPRKTQITLAHLLSMRSGLNGLDFQADGPWVHSPDWSEAVLQSPLGTTPGKKFELNLGTSHLLSVLITETTKQSTRRYAQTKLFAPLGVQIANWDTDTQGRHIGGFGLHLRARDLAKFGQLILDLGRWGEQQILPGDWVRDSTRVAGQAGAEHDTLGHYGYGWWSNNTRSVSVSDNGHMLIVSPRHDSVIVLVATPGRKTHDWVSAMLARLDDLLTRIEPVTRVVSKTETLSTGAPLTASQPVNSTEFGHLAAQVAAIAKVVGIDRHLQQHRTRKNTNFRSAPDVTSPVMRLLPKGTPVAAIANNGQWLRVEVDGEQGWVHADLVTTHTPASNEVLRELSSTLQQIESALAINNSQRPEESGVAAQAASEIQMLQVHNNRLTLEVSVAKQSLIDVQQQVASLESTLKTLREDAELSKQSNAAADDAAQKLSLVSSVLEQRTEQLQIANERLDRVAADKASQGRAQTELQTQLEQATNTIDELTSTQTQLTSRNLELMTTVEALQAIASEKLDLRQLHTQILELESVLAIETDGSLSHQTTKALNVRSRPSINSPRVGLLPMAHQFSVIAQADGWLQLMYKGQPAWVSGRFTAPIDEQATASPAAIIARLGAIRETVLEVSTREKELSDAAKLVSVELARTTEDLHVANEKLATTQHQLETSQTSLASVKTGFAGKLQEIEKVYGDVRSEYEAKSNLLATSLQELRRVVEARSVENQALRIDNLALKDKLEALVRAALVSRTQLASAAEQNQTLLEQTTDLQQQIADAEKQAKATQSEQQAQMEKVRATVGAEREISAGLRMEIDTLIASHQQQLLVEQQIQQTTLDDSQLKLQEKQHKLDALSSEFERLQAASIELERQNEALLLQTKVDKQRRAQFDEVLSAERAAFGSELTKMRAGQLAADQQYQKVLVTLADVSRKLGLDGEKLGTYVVHRPVNLRAGPGTNHDILAAVDVGTQLLVSGADHDWLKVRIGDREGWLRSDFAVQQPLSEIGAQDLLSALQAFALNVANENEQQAAQLAHAQNSNRELQAALDENTEQIRVLSIDRDTLTAQSRDDVTLRKAAGEEIKRLIETINVLVTEKDLLLGEHEKQRQQFALRQSQSETMVQEQQTNLQEKHRQVAELSQQLENSRAKLAAIHVDMRTVAEKYQHKQAEVAAKSSEWKALNVAQETRIADLLDKNQKLSTQLAHLDAETVTTSNQHTQYVQTLETQLQTLRLDNERLIIRDREQSEALAMQQAETERLLARLEQLKNHQPQLVAEFEEREQLLKQQVLQLTAERDQFQNASMRATEKVASLRDELQSIAVRGENADLALTDELLEKDERIRSLVADNEERERLLKQQVLKLTAERDQFHNANMRATEKAASLRDELQSIAVRDEDADLALTNELLEKDERIRSLVADNEEREQLLKQQVLQLTEERDQHQSASMRAAEKVASLRDELQSIAARGENADLALTNELLEKNERIRSLEADYRTLVSDNDRLRANLDQVRAAYNAQRESVGTLVSRQTQIVEKFGDLKAVLKALEVERNQLAQKDAIAHQKSVALEQQNIVLRQRVESADGTIAKLKADVLELQRPLDDADEPNLTQRLAQQTQQLLQATSTIDLLREQVRVLRAMPSSPDKGREYGDGTDVLVSTDNSARIVLAGTSGDSPTFTKGEALVSAASDPDTAAHSQVDEFLRQWTQAWSKRDVQGYLSMYADEFKPQNGISRDVWEHQRVARISKPQFIDIRIGELAIDDMGDNRLRATFRQDYRADHYADQVVKVLELKRTDSGWGIVSERAQQ